MSRRQQISEAALELFSQIGYAAVGMRQLASSLGMEAASLYSHVKNKEELLQEICFGVAEDFFAAMEAVENTELAGNESLRAAIAGHVQVVADNTRAATIFLHEWRHLSEPSLTQFSKMRRQYEDYFTRLVQQGIDDGSFRPLDARFTTTTLLASLNAVATWYRPGGKLAPREIAQRLADQFLLGAAQPHFIGHELHAN